MWLQSTSRQVIGRSLAGHCEDAAAINFVQVEPRNAAAAIKKKRPGGRGEAMSAAAINFEAGRMRMQSTSRQSEESGCNQLSGDLNCWAGAACIKREWLGRSSHLQSKVAMISVGVLVEGRRRRRRQRRGGPWCRGRCWCWCIRRRSRWHSR